MAEARKSSQPESKAKTKYTCDICGQDGLSEENMRSHVLIEHVEGQISCPFCDLDGTTLEEMDLHVNAQHLDYLTPTKESHRSSERPGEPTTESSNCDSLKSSGTGKYTATESSNCDSLKSSGTGKYSVMTADSIEAPPTDPTMSPQSPMEITITQARDSPKQHRLNFDSDDARSMSSEGEQSLKRAKLYLNVPQVTGSKARQKILGNVLPGTDIHVTKYDNDTKNSPRDRKGQSLSDKINTFCCPMCSWTCKSPNEITLHVNVQHLDALTPSKTHSSQGQLDSENNNLSLTSLALSSGGSARPDTGFDCPLCGVCTSSGSSLELHVNSQHSDILSPASSLNQTPLSEDSSTVSSPQCSCPMCGMECSDSSSLQMHVDGHFSAEHTPVTDHEDSLLAQEIERKDREALKVKEEKEFERLQELYGMKGNKNYKKQAQQNLEQAVYNGQMSIADFFTKKQEVHQSSSTGVDDGHSCTKDILAKIQHYYKSSSTNAVNAHWLASPTCHYAASYGDKGWGCGYRNFQMLLSCLSNNATYEQVLFNGRPIIPSIPKIQRLIETAWQKGFDQQGCDQLGGKVVDTTKWIGATEILATLSSLRIKCQLVDFHAPSGKDSTHPRLFEWVRDYFRRDSEFKPPLYLQHQGHSRSIVGIEELRDRSLRLLLFDPSCGKKQMSQFITTEVSANLMRTVRRPLSSMKAKQYQIVAVRGIISEKEYEDSKILKSDRIPS